jgi:hypothetical protein
MSKRTTAKQNQTVYKEFTDLTVMKRIDMTAVAIYEVHRTLEAEAAFEPKPNTQLHRIWKLKKFDMTQQRGWIAFRREAQEAFGKSGPVTSSYGEFTDGGDGDGFRVPKAFVNDAHRNIEYLMRYYLIYDEALLLRDLIKDDVQNHENFNIELIGFMKAGYKKEETARANGIGHIQCLLTRLGRFYRF